MVTSDTCVTIHPYFRIPADQLTATRALTERFIALTETESGCLYYGFSINDSLMHCREGYTNAESLLIHLKNVGPLIEELLSTGVTLERLEVHGPADEITQLRGPLADLNPEFFTLESGFRR